MVFFGAVALVMMVIGAGLYHLSASERTPASAMAAVSPQASGKPLERTAAFPPLSLPSDDAPHGSAMEWWYYSGILRAETGQGYAVHMVVFVANGLVKHTVMHAALTDLQTGKRYVSQSRTGGTPARSVAYGFDFRQEGWQVTASPSFHVLQANFDGASIAFDLGVSGPVVAHRAPGSETPGLLDFGNSGISYYYSRPRMPARGSIAIAGKSVPVSGELWFDHQWGEFDVLTLGWNWFALHLDDGSDLMVYELFDMDGRKVMTAGTHSDAQGSQAIEPGQVELAPGRTWTSPKTGIGYIVEWDIKLPTGVLNIKPFFADSEFDSGATTANVYWEGPVKVGGSRQGQGFLELSGYDRLRAKPAKSK
ncbi:putative secreted hydrolase [Variovorax sp. PBS-H4]|uniref:lipocalin family protein n=1 Tax=Variovorax sp. PBS-H4 TaxID=434008 RepID=UPI001316090E|nr:lipocalin family protein [Variovorax sp. PBS-H4]VTU25729.1 putative secreted hydrolase [Variovorax sp. PBS-H4]